MHPLQARMDRARWWRTHLRLRCGTKAERGKLIMIADVRRVTAAYYGVSIDDMNSARRNVAVARPRMVAMYLAKMLTAKSLSEIGRCFADRDHTTVLNATRRIEELRQRDRELDRDVRALLDHFEGGIDQLNGTA